MIPDWPYLSPYAEAAARLREAIDVAAIQAAADNLAASMRDVATVNNTHATNIRDDLDDLINEGERRVETALSAPNSEEGLA